MLSNNKPSINQYGICDYHRTWVAMQNFVKTATDDSREQFWLLQHPPVYTLGRAGKITHHLRDNNIPLIHCDRGGQITYHGPGQLIVYMMINWRRRQLSPKRLINHLQNAIITVLKTYGIIGKGNDKAPGVYVNQAKIVAFGLRFSRAWTYHGLSFNVDMDLSPFDDINPCGYSQLTLTQMRHHLSPDNLPSLSSLGTQVAEAICQQLNI